jgi:hypothetical protein
VGVNERRISAARRLSNGPNCFTLSGFRLSPSASTSAITARANEPMSAGNAVIYAALGLPPPGGTPLDSLIPPGRLWVVDSRQSGPPSRCHPGRWDSVPEIAPVNPAG